MGEWTRWARGQDGRGRKMGTSQWRGMLLPMMLLPIKLLRLSGATRLAIEPLGSIAAPARLVVIVTLLGHDSKASHNSRSRPPSPPTLGPAPPRRHPASPATPAHTMGAGTRPSLSHRLSRIHSPARDFDQGNSILGCPAYFWVAGADRLLARLRRPQLPRHPLLLLLPLVLPRRAPAGHATLGGRTGAVSRKQHQRYRKPSLASGAQPPGGPYPAAQGIPRSRSPPPTPPFTARIPVSRRRALPGVVLDTGKRGPLDTRAPCGRAMRRRRARRADRAGRSPDPPSRGASTRPSRLI